MSKEIDDLKKKIEELEKKEMDKIIEECQHCPCKDCKRPYCKKVYPYIPYIPPYEPCPPYNPWRDNIWVRDTTSGTIPLRTNITWSYL